jgi:DNA-binding beta-propeller fold protein YncE
MRLTLRDCHKAILWLFSATFVCASLHASEDFRATTNFVGANDINFFSTPVNQLLTPAGKQVELPGMRPESLALSPDGKLLVTSGTTHELVVVDPATGQILQHVKLPTDNIKDAPTQPVSDVFLNADLKAQASFTGLVFSPDGSRIYLSNVNGDIKVFSVQSGKVAPLFSIPLPPAKAPRRSAEIPAGLAVSSDGKRLYVALNLSNRFAELDARTGRILRIWDVGVEPFFVVLAGNKAYVSNWGGRRPDADSITGPAGDGMRVRVDPVHYAASEGSVSVINLDSGTNETEIITGLHASGLALSPNGHYLVVANAGSDTLTVIDTRKDQIVEQICARQNPGDLFGAQPNAVAFDKSGRTLFACNGTQNAVAVFKFEPGRSKLLGLVPVGWFPGSIVNDSRRHQICVANLKRLSPGRPNKKTGRTEYNSLDSNGSLSLVPMPSSRELSAMTQQALANMRYPLLAQSKLPARPDQPARAVPERVGEPSLIKHVVYIIKENRTYDQVLGDIKEGNGDDSLCVFGERFTPNQHKLVREFALLDNTYDCGSRSADGHQWADSAIGTDYLERSYADGFPRSYPAAGDINNEDALAYSPAGFIWDNALSHGKTVRDYGEYATPHKRWKDPAHKGHPSFLDVYQELVNGTDTIEIWSEPNIESVRPCLVKDTVGFDLSIPDVFRATRFAKDVKQFEQSGDLPNLCIIWLSSDHTGGTSPGAPTPAAEIADNDLAVGKIVEAISHSKFWKDTCVFSIEDDPQAGWDHVSGFRTTAYVASPYIKRGQVIHTQYNQTSLLRTIELILGLPPMNQMDATATPMFDCFTDLPDLAPFNTVPSNIPLDQVNPPIKKISDPLLRKDAYASSRLPLEKADQCPEDVLNRILWHAMRGTKQPYPQWAVTADDDAD